MPKKKSNMRIEDPFVMSEDIVNFSIKDFLVSNGFQNVKHLTGSQRGIDVFGKKVDGEYMLSPKDLTVIATTMIQFLVQGK